MNACKRCGSFAINPTHHGRDGSDNDMCDVCYWRKRATPPADAAGAARALSMLSSAALDHYTPYMVCVPTEKWVEAFALAGSLEITPPADAALADALEHAGTRAEFHPDSEIAVLCRKAAAALRARAVPDYLVCAIEDATHPKYGTYLSIERRDALADALKRAMLAARQPAQAVADVWIAHDGCKCPLPAGVLVETRWRNGREFAAEDCRPDGEAWSWPPSSTDADNIVAYRLAASKGGA